MIMECTREEMMNVNEIERLMLVSMVYLPCLNSILGGKTKKNKSKEFVKDMIDENDESPHMEKLPQQVLTANIKKIKIHIVEYDG